MYLSVLETACVFLQSLLSKLKLYSQFAQLHGHLCVGFRKLGRFHVLVLELAL